MSTRKYRIILLFMTLVGFTCLSAENAGSVLKHVVNRMNSQPVEVRFEVKAHGITQPGVLTIDKECFTLLSDDISTWYDGETQWTLSPSINEVSMTTPTQEELAEINPLLVLGEMSSRFNVELGNAGAGSYVLNLAAREKSNPISSATIVVDARDWTPTTLTILTSTGERYDITIKKVKNIEKTHVSIFRFNKKIFPDVQVIDLR